MEPHSYFHWADYLVFGLALLMSTLVGIFFAVRRKGQGTVDNFLMADRKMQVLPVSVSMYVTWVSAISFIADPVEAYFYGAIYWMIGVGYALGPIPAAYFFVPKFHKMKLVSMYQFLEKRFNRKMRLLGSTVGILSTVIFSGVVIYAPAVALAQVSGLAVWVSIITIGVVTTFYSTLGGMKAVLWADTLQMFIMLCGLVIVVVRGTMQVGGVSEVWRISKEGGRINMNSFSPSPLERATIWTGLIGGFFRVFKAYVAQQTLVQRFCTIQNVKKAQMAVYLNVPMYFITPALLGFLGLVMYAFYHDCDPLASGRITRKDQLVPILFVDILGFIPGLPGLFLASVFSASMSSFSSAQNAVAALILQDYILPTYSRATGKIMNERLATTVAKISGVSCGCCSMALAFLLLLYSEGSLFQVANTVTGVAQGPLVGVMVLALVFPCVDTLCCFLGFSIATLVSCWLAVGRILYPPSAHHLPVQTTGCAQSLPGVNTTLLGSTYSNAAVTFPTMLMEGNSSYSDITSKRFNFSEVYSFSPILLAPLTVILTVSVGLLATGVKVLFHRWHSSHSIATEQQESLKSQNEKECEIELMDKSPRLT